MKRIVYRFLALTVFCLPIGNVLSAGDPSGPVSGKFIVKLKSNAKADLLRKGLSGQNRLEKLSKLTVKNHLKGSDTWQRFYTFSTSDATLTAADVTAALGGAGNVEFVEPDYYLEFFGLPTDSSFSHQWYLYNRGQEYLGVVRVAGTYNDYVTLKTGSLDKDIRLISQYESPPSESTKVVVAIVDTGIDPTHPQLNGRLWRNPDEIPRNGVDDDHNGFVDDTLGYDVSGDILNLFDPVGDNDPTDDYGHGTHIAGIVAANADGKGVVGIAPWVELMAVKIRPNATSAVGAAGIMYAVNAGAQVINISWGTPFESTILREAIDFARLNGVLVCIAPGNTGDNTRFFPAAFDSTFVVGAGNSAGFVTDFSTFGAHIDIVAPGLDILSLRAAGTDMYADPRVGEPGIRIIDDLYYLSDGTSMATPMVVGAAALALSFRPDLTLPELEDMLLFGATDLIDPHNSGDTLIGPDTISGYGYLNIDASLDLLLHGGVYIVEPQRRNRYTTDFPVKIAPVAGYQGSWVLEYSVGLGSEAWQYLAAGDSLPRDSVAFVFSDPAAQGFIRLRVTDKFASSQITDVVYVTNNKTVVTSPTSGGEVNYNVPIYGSVHGPQYDSMVILARPPVGQLRRLFASTGEFFDSLIFNWAVSGSDTGNFTINLMGYFQSGVTRDTVSVRIKSAFALGWPRPLGGRSGMTAVSTDLNHDGIREVVVGTRNGLFLFHGPDGSTVRNFPVLVGRDVRCVPAIYDVDRDGEDEIICTNDSGIYVINYDGSFAGGWPQLCFTGMIPYEYAYPNPVVVQLRQPDLSGSGVPDSGIIIINKIGQILAYRFNGDAYFFSTGGLFARLDPRLTESFGVGGSTSPFVTATSLIDQNMFDVVATYTSPYPYTGLGVFQGANGQPKFDDADPVVQNIRYVHGTALADLTGDLLPEIITSGYDSEGISRIWVKTLGADDVPGWPVALPEVSSWIASYPTAADLDLDGVPEVLSTFFEFDIGALYVFKADGSPYIVREGRPAGEVFVEPVALGTPVVANLLGDEHPEIIMRSGYILPGTGPERLHILDYAAEPVPGWPIVTPARPGRVFSSRYAPLVDDVDGDGLVEVALVSDADELLVWNLDASSDQGKNVGRFLMNNRNTNVLPVRIPTGVSDGPPLVPSGMALHQNYPNPFNATTTIRFTLPARSQVRLEVLNVLGQIVATVIDHALPEGRHEVEYDAADLATGVYFYRLKVGGFVQTRKMVLIK
ncbi:MAG TPA: S8/S53 family peptidase [Candidatus Deferrimicrobium sp.]|nr:S8/S53 family peptidase [Candidatus Deferrimicrobium sp.]